MIGAICLKIDDKCKAKLYLAGTYNNIDWTDENISELGEQFVVCEFKANYNPQPPIIVAKGLDDKYVLRLIETKRYIIKMESETENIPMLPRFQNEGNKFLKCDWDKDSVSFQFINYLGRSKLIFTGDDGIIRLKFEVIPDKMNYEDDYIKLTEALAESCSSLLLEYSGLTSNVYEQSEEDQKTLLEQFIFLRQFCYGQNLQGLFESVKRNPDRRLVSEEEYKPVGVGIPSKKFYTNPYSNSRGWTNFVECTGKRKYIPQEVAVTRKYDSIDTTSNRFIKYALQKFDEVCVSLIKILEGDEKSKQVECLEEAKTIHKILKSIFMDSFFDKVGILDIMPQNNQVLHKREGYSQIFSAYTMLDLSLQLNWKGKDDVYEGESKNVALLYEYWLFFVLYKIIKSIDGCEIIETNETPFLLVDDGITISLEEGKKSCQSFELEKYGTKINLYYNRTFSRAEFQTTKYEGSYSRPFRPDYTLAIFPALYSKGRYNGESEAIKNGAVSYVHFDAKYRISDLTAFMESHIEPEEEVAEDKVGSIVNTYRRGDLLKMHTYNDAIRRTIGSYVLYPGSYIAERNRNETFQLYDEVLPGVGAFSIKPSNDTQGECELKNFIVSLIVSRCTDNSRLNRVKYYTEMVLREPSIFNKQKIEGSDTSLKKGDMCVMGYIRADSDDDYYFYLRNNGFLKNGSEFLFYFYAIKDGNVYSHHKDVFRVSYFRFYKNKIRETDTYKLEPVLCKIVSNELISKAELVTNLQNAGYNTSEEKHHADFYYALTIRVEEEAFSTDELKASEVNSQNGNDTFSPHSPKVISY